MDSIDAICKVLRDVVDTATAEEPHLPHVEFVTAIVIGAIYELSMSTTTPRTAAMVAHTIACHLGADPVIIHALESVTKKIEVPN